MTLRDDRPWRFVRFTLRLQMRSVEKGESGWVVRKMQRHAPMRYLMLATLLLGPGLALGCSHDEAPREVSRTAKTTPNLTGGHTTEVNSVKQNPDGSTTVERTKVKTD